MGRHALLGTGLPLDSLVPMMICEGTVAELENATFITLSRRARAILNNTVDFDVLRGGVSSTEAPRPVVTELGGPRSE